MSGSYSLVQEPLNFLVETKPRISMVIHVESVLVRLVELMIVHRALTEHGIDAMMLAEENISQKFLAFELLLLHRLGLLAEFIHNPVDIRRNIHIFSS
jgi:hypothetical protein